MICVGFSDILYPGGSLGENYRVRVFAIRARGYITLYADDVYIHYIDRHIRFVSPLRPQYMLR